MRAGAPGAGKGGEVGLTGRRWAEEPTTATLPRLGAWLGRPGREAGRRFGGCTPGALAWLLPPNLEGGSAVEVCQAEGQRSAVAQLQPQQRVDTNHGVAQQAGRWAGHGAVTAAWSGTSCPGLGRLWMMVWLNSSARSVALRNCWMRFLMMGSARIWLMLGRRLGSLVIILSMRLRSSVL